MNMKSHDAERTRAEVNRLLDEHEELGLLVLEMASLMKPLTGNTGTLDQAESNVRAFTDELGRQCLTLWGQRRADEALQTELGQGDCRPHEKKRS